MKAPVDENGVPIWSANQLEIKAEEVIELFDPQVLLRPVRTGLTSIVDRCRSDYGLIVDFSSDLGSTSRGGKILGEYIFKPRTIRIDQTILNDPRFDFTLAHEFGHFVLHRAISIKQTDYSGNEIRDTESDFVTGHKILSTPRDWIEWQANQFAAAILLPRATILDAVVEAQREAGVSRNLGRIILENRGYSFNDLNRVIEKLHLIYGPSKAVIQNRLQDLGILVDLRDKDVNHISKLFREE